MEHRQSTVSSAYKRPSLKSNSQFNKSRIWKDKLRENCYKRVREGRTRLLWKMRIATSQSCKQNQEDIIRSALQDIVSDELKKMKELSFYNPSKNPTSDSELDDILWEYDGVHTTYQGECEEMLLEMQRIFYEDLKAEPNIEAIDCISETWQDEEDEFLACALFEHMQLNSEETQRQEIWCPICKQGELKENRDLIYCTRCELRLSKANELMLILSILTKAAD
ncbi:uncharacterized protein LOC129300722 isoform X2 [Prosopis cineraria]|uniref:uncharacterized protein LOC129300722 isoform X2 n=2 Tax=Prosopis cineraria TaxID=364024 RepID=UPI00240FB796|nr:uncharacterized protein LOC129300722 isoform X2 [Prosopis cineraria]